MNTEEGMKRYIAEEIRRQKEEQRLMEKFLGYSINVIFV